MPPVPVDSNDPEETRDSGGGPASTDRGSNDVDSLAPTADSGNAVHGVSPVEVIASPPATRSNAADPTSGELIGGRFRLSEKVGEGGMGSVWVAHQSEPVKRKVAVKLIKAGMDSRAVVSRFEAERQALAMMDHPNIAKVLDGGVHEGRPYFVMELVKGVPITRFCDERKLTPRQRLELFVPVCQAIQHAHQKGIIHRDIKPSNVLVALYDDRPVPKVIDFGVAKATGGALTEDAIETALGGVVGTPQYMSPEQATLNNLDIDTRSDVYALGVLLYELLTGTPPFSGAELQRKGLLEILRVVREEEPPRPSTKLSSSEALPSLSAVRGTDPRSLTGLLRNELDWIVMKALEKDRARRYETANGFAADVLRYLAGEPVQAHPPSVAYRVGKFVRRYRVPVLAGTLIVLTLVGGIVGTTLGLLRAKAAKDKESEQRLKAEAAYAKTAEVLNLMVSDLTGESLATQKEITPEQRKFLAEVLKYYGEFAAAEGEDEQTRARVAEAAYRVGRIQFRLGRLEEAATAIRRTLDEYAKLAADVPANAKYRVQQAASHDALGILLAGLGERAETEEQFRQGMAIREALVAGFPTVAEYRGDLARSLINLGLLVTDSGKRTEAEQLFRKGLVITEKLAADFPSVPDYRRGMAVCHGNLGVLFEGQGKRAEAEEQYRRGLAVGEKLVADFPNAPEYRGDLANRHTQLGTLLAGLGKRGDAEEQFRRGLAIQERLTVEFPSVPVYRSGLAANHTSLGILLAGQGKWAETQEQYRKGLVIREKLVADFPAVPEYRADLANSHTNLGFLLAGQGGRPEALEQFRRALALFEKLAAEFPAITEYPVGLGGTCANLGKLMQDGGDFNEALSLFERAIRTLRPVLEAEPRAVAPRQFLRSSHRGRAETFSRLEKHAEAVKDWDRAVELAPPEERPRPRSFRASALARAGRVAEAVSEVAELRAMPGWNAEQWYGFAAVSSIASSQLAQGGAEHADAAIGSLTKAIEVGFRDVARLGKDRAFDPLRGRADFRKLLADLESKAPSGKEDRPAPKGDSSPKPVSASPRP